MVRQTDRHSDRPTDNQSNRQTDRQTDRQTVVTGCRGSTRVLCVYPLTCGMFNALALESAPPRETGRVRRGREAMPEGITKSFVQRC